MGGEDKEKERARGETIEDQGNKRMVVAFVPVCMHACDSFSGTVLQRKIVGTAS